MPVCATCRNEQRRRCDLRLTAQERETIINFNQAEDIAYIYTCDPKWWRHFDRLGIKPTQVHKGSTGAVYARDYEVPKKWVKPPKPPRRLSLTDEQRKAIAQRLRPTARIP